MTAVMAPCTAAAAAAPYSLSLSDESQDAQDISTSRPVGSQRSQTSRERIPSYAESRMSSFSKRSRPQSNLYSSHSSLPYALVRDFAYPSFHPMHFGAPPDDPSGASTPHSEWNSSRRMSELPEGSMGSGRGSWIAGPWGGDGAMYGDPQNDMEPLPSTSFSSTDIWGDDHPSLKTSKHRKSRSIDVPEYERGRRRESTNDRLSDPAGRDALRHSRGFLENGENRRDSHNTTGGTLPSRSYPTSQPIDPDEQIPLDEEPSRHSAQRESIGPEDEELFAGPSLALYSFEPENDNELRLTEGQTIMVSYRHGQGWLVAENPHTGEQGLVPEQYVRLLKDIEGWDVERGGFIDDLIEGVDIDAEASQGLSEDLHVVGPSELKEVHDTDLLRDHGANHDAKTKEASKQET